MDWSRIPEPMRSKLQSQLERLPAEYRGQLEARLAKLPADKLEEVLAKTAPMLEKLMQKQKSANVATKAHAPGTGMTGRMHAPHHVNDPNNHYNQTVRRGDRPMPSLMVIILAFVLVMSLFTAWGWLDWGAG
jgi:hypothetical protein